MDMVLAGKKKKSKIPAKNSQQKSNGNNIEHIKNKTCCKTIINYCLNFKCTVDVSMPRCR